MDCPPCEECGLRKLGAFRSNTGAEIHFIQALKSMHLAVAAQQTVVHEGVPAGLYTLYSGWAFRYKSLSDGRRQILNFLLPGDLIGLQDQANQTSPHGVEAITSVELCQFDRSRLWDLYRHFPALGYDVTWLAAHEESLIDENLLSVGRRSAAERIATLLIHLYKRAAALGMVVEERVPFPLNQQHIADATGLSLVHTNKTMRRLYKLGLFELDAGWLGLPQPRALQRLADYFDRALPTRPLI